MLKQKKISSIVLVVVSSFLGGAFSTALLQPPAVLAQAYRSLIGDKLQIMNHQGTRTADIITPANAGGLLNLYGEDGSLRIQAGTYSAAGERGLPLIGLSDNKAKLRMLFRLAGRNESPVLIFKDKSGRDRIVMGLDMSDSAQEPFLALIDKKGKKRPIFGKY